MMPDGIARWPPVASMAGKLKARGERDLRGYDHQYYNTWYHIMMIGVFFFLANNNIRWVS